MRKNKKRKKHYLDILQRLGGSYVVCQAIAHADASSFYVEDD